MPTPPPQLIAQGYFDPEGNPRLKVKLSGLFNPAGIELESIIDTGFSGFLSMPIIQAFPIGLALSGTTTLQFADGSKGSKLLALGMLQVGAVQKMGTVILQEGPASVLIGMDFIRTFNIALIMQKTSIFLLDHAWLDQAMAAATASASQPPRPSAGTAPTGASAALPPPSPPSPTGLQSP
jgi:predicted aspartyl protease